MPGLLKNTMVRDPAGKGLFGGLDWSSLGPMLLALGSGIASGGAPGGGGWGGGIGRGLAGASEALQNKTMMDLRKAALERENENAAATSAYRAANLGLRGREVASSEEYRDAQIANLENPQAKIGATVEGIRGKLSRGEQLTPGEQKVYEDVIRVDYLTRLLARRRGWLARRQSPWRGSAVNRTSAVRVQCKPTQARASL